MDLKEQLKNKVFVAKLAIGAIVMLGVSKIVGDVIENNTNSDSALDRIKIKIGTLALGWMVADASARYVERGIDFVVEMWKETKIELREVQKESEK